MHVLVVECTVFMQGGEVLVMCVSKLTELMTMRAAGMFQVYSKHWIAFLLTASIALNRGLEVFLGVRNPHRNAKIVPSWSLP